jgi:hypothetical protein
MRPLAPLASGDSYTKGLGHDHLGIDLDGDGGDEMFFYRSDGLYRFYDIRPDGTIPNP